MKDRTYRYFKGTPLYPFGYGLSYTTFEYSNLRTNETSETASPVSVTVDVKNSGKVDGEEVVQLYVSNKTAKSEVPIVALKGFKRVNLKKGEQKSVTFTLNPEDFSTTNGDAKQIVEAGTFEIAVDRAVPGKNSLVKTIKLTGNTVEIK